MPGDPRFVSLPEFLQGPADLAYTPTPCVIRPKTQPLIQPLLLRDASATVGDGQQVKQLGRRLSLPPPPLPPAHPVAHVQYFEYHMYHHPSFKKLQPSKAVGWPAAVSTSRPEFPGPKKARRRSDQDLLQGRHLKGVKLEAAMLTRRVSFKPSQLLHLSPTPVSVANMPKDCKRITLCSSYGLALGMCSEVLGDCWGASKRPSSVAI